MYREGHEKIRTSLLTQKQRQGVILVLRKGVLGVSKVKVTKDSRVTDTKGPRTFRDAIRSL